MPSTTGIVLCGGAGTRFAGQDKPLLPLRGKALVEHVLERLAPQVDEVIVSANRHLDDYRRFGCPVVADQLPDQGPLAGIAAAARQCRSELLFVCPGDSPFIARDLVARLMPLLVADVDAVIPYDGERTQHLFILLRRTAAADIDDYLQAGGRSVRDWLAGLSTARSEIHDPRAFTNVNSPAMLAELDGDR